MTDKPDFEPTKNHPANHDRYWYIDLILVLILAVGGYLRLVGISWDENQHLHPDERFLTMVETHMSPVDSIAQYFNTDQSTLNPHNVGHSFYVYGDFPIIFTRYVAEWTGQAGYDTVNILGRQLSAVFDLLTLCMVFAIGKKAYDRRIGLLASAFYSMAVVPIQLSHFFAVDTFLCFFVSVAIYAAVSIYQLYLENSRVENGETVAPTSTWLGIGYYLLFGAGLGLAMACKVSAAPLAVILPLAVMGWYAKLDSREKSKWLGALFRNIALAAIFAFFLFRIFQPYAFAGPGFFNISPNPKFVANLVELSGQTNGDADYPPALQWARRSKFFAFTNLTEYGTGLPLGILGWAGVLYMTYRMLRKDWAQHLPIWGWTVGYFTWQSLLWNPMMRYTYLIYPTFCLIAAWFIFQLWDHRKGTIGGGQRIKPVWSRITAVALGAIVLVGTGIWGYAFSRIYTRPVTRIAASRWIFQNIPGPINLTIATADGTDYHQPLAYPSSTLLLPDNPVSFDFTANASGELTDISIFRIVDSGNSPQQKEVTITITDAETNTQLTSASVTSTFLPQKDVRGIAVDIPLQKPVSLADSHRYNIRLDLVSGDGILALQGSAIANESDWDDGLPLRLDNYDGYGGIYNGNPNFQMYWDENEEKRERFVDTLDEADYLVISSNRQWGTTTRVPERYPLATLYYRNLIGCPDEMELLQCYAQVQPGMFQGTLGFDLVEVFQSNPSIAGWQFNDQLAEESFTVYDHPKVFLFKKSTGYNSASVRALFNTVDLTHVIHTKLNEVPDHPQDLMLPEIRLAVQQAGGTWSKLFNREALFNKYPGLAVVFWYVVLLLLGWAMQPLLQLVFPGLRDRGYAFGRIVGMLLLALLTWWIGSLGIPVTATTISMVAGVLVAINLVLGWIQRDELKAYFQSQKKHILLTELVILAFFLLDLGIRIGNPDLWHVSKGGEKPMDFAYLNAVIKSTTFPPYDPWYSGGYINYYYYGFVIVGVLVKWLGIIPSIAYNLILPTLFSLLAIGAYTIIYNLVVASRAEKAEPDSGPSPYWFAVAAAIGLTVLGNFGTVTMIWNGLQQMAAPGGNISVVGATIFTRIGWVFQGLGQFISGQSLPYNIGEWYWNPSRVIPAPNDVEPITEFPFFTFLYADLHAHMIALPITLLVLGWITSIILGKGRWGTAQGRLPDWSLLASLMVGSIAVGALRPTNTWDFPTYLVLALVALGYAFFRWRDSFSGGWLDKSVFSHRIVKGALVVVVFVGLTMLFYQPFSKWYGAGYTSIRLWDGGHTPFSSYLIHWGFFLFFIIAWMIQETVDWMATTPLRHLAYVRPYRNAILTIGIIFLAVAIGLSIQGVSIAWFVILLMAWTLILLLRSDQTDLKRMILFLILSGLFLTLMVEVVVLVGDIGRMNTVFKFYLQVWSLFAISAAASLYWLVSERAHYRVADKNLFQIVATLALLGVILFPMTATVSKVKDRFTDTASHSLDGMAYMLDATYLEHDINTDSTAVLELEQDYHAIRWMQDNIQGSPVIVEGSVTEYKWGARYSIYTGLPAVVGWNWHQRQQRGVADSTWVEQRVNEVNEFYATPDLEATLAFLKKYHVSYIVVGQMEEAIYPQDGLAKFEAYAGTFWKPVYRYKSTTIYQVLPGD